MKQRPQCQANVSDTAKFCVKCGFNIKKHEEEMAKEYFCPECGTKFSGSTFCPECGYDVSADIGEQPDEMADSSAPSGRVNPHAFNPFEYEKHSNGAYTITGLKDKAAIHYTVPQGVIAIADNAFEGCLAFSVSLPEGLLKIGSAAFKACENLLTVNLPSSLVIVGDEAFADCEILDIELPATLLRVGKDVTRNTLTYKKKREEELSHYQVGDIINFGLYKKDNGMLAQPIEWIVTDKIENRVLLLSYNAIDRIQFGTEDAHWNKCYLRSWLNSDFINKAFTEDERKKIQTVSVSTPYISDTSDKIFLLSSGEVSRYSNQIAAKCQPTSFAKDNGAVVSNDHCYWWLRNISSSKVATIDPSGNIGYYNFADSGVCVRPAMWIKI